MGIELLEKEMEEILIKFEQKDKFNEALQGYKSIEVQLHRLLDTLTDKEVAYSVLAQCYLRQGNMYRVLGNAIEATRCSEKEAESARLSGNSIVIAQSIFSEGITLISNKQLQPGLTLLDRSKELFDSGETFDHLQGSGWYWIIKADIANQGITESTPEETIDFANKAIKILEPIENWRGVSRAFLARSIAYRKIGKVDLADKDLLKSKEFE